MRLIYAEYLAQEVKRSRMKVSLYNAIVYKEENRFNPELPDIFIVHIHICIPIYIYACIVINIFVLKAQNHLLQ